MQKEIYNSDVRAKEGTEGYIGLLFAHLNKMSNNLSNPELANNSANMELLTELIISHIPEPEKRKELKLLLKNRFIELKKEREIDTGKPITDDYVKYLRVKSAISVVGECFDWINLHIGITKNARIQFDLNCSQCKHKLYSEEHGGTK